MPITLGGRTYSDDEVRQFYANGGNEAAFAQQNGLSDAEAQSAMSQARSITSSPASPAPASNSFTGVNSVDYNKGVFSPTENRWIPNAEIQNFFAANPNMSATEMNRLAGNLGMNPYSINYAAHVGTGSKGPRDPAYAQLVHELEASQWRGDSGYGADFDAAHRAGTNPLTAGAGNTQYKMPDGSYYSVRVKDGKPQESYASALQSFNAGQAANPGWHNGGNAATVPTPERPPAETYQPWTRPTQTAAPVVTPGQVSGNPAVTQTPAIAQTPLQPPTNSFPTPVLNALYAAQQQRMLSPAPTFNFQNGMQAQPTGTTGPLTQVAQQPAQGAMPALPPQIQPPPNPYGGVPNSQYPIGPGQAGWVNSKDGSGLTPGTGGGDPYEPGGGLETQPYIPPGTGGGDPYQPGPGGAVAGTSLNLPSTWGGMGAAEKINWFNQNNVSVDAMRQNGVADDEIAWMKQNGYTAGGPAAGAMPALPPQIQPPPNPYGGVPNSQYPIGPGQTGWVNSKDGSGLSAGQTPGTGGGDPYEPGNTAGSVNLPATWGSMGAAEKIDWFNQNNINVEALKQNGVTDSEIAWMNQNGYTGGPAMGGGGPNPGDPKPGDPKPGDPGYFTTRQPETGGGDPNPYASNGWVASGSGGTKPGAGGNELHPGPGLGGGGFNPIDPGFNVNPGAPELTNWQEQMQPYIPPGTGGMEPIPEPQPIPQSWGRSAPTPEPAPRVMPAGGFSGLLGGTNVAEIYNSQPRNFAQGGALTRAITQR